MTYVSGLPLLSPIPVDPPEAASTGLCERCEGDFGQHAYTYSCWPLPDTLICGFCVSQVVSARLLHAEAACIDDVMDILQSVDEVAVCKDCGQFVRRVS